MFEMDGHYTSAKVFCDFVEEEAMREIYSILNHRAFKDCKIRIMPDVHAGRGCVIGFTSTFDDVIVPFIVGVDLDCSMIAVRLSKSKFELNEAALDEFIRANIPHGNKNYYINLEIDNSVKKTELEEAMLKVLSEIGDYEHRDHHLRSVGSLGGGNHFIEVDKDEDENLYLVIHTGSRNFGLKVANFHQKKAREFCEANNMGVPRDTEFLMGADLELYLNHVSVAKMFALRSRTIIAERICHFLGVDMKDVFHTTHNYIDIKNKIIRKGAISAYDGELSLIPFNSSDGSAITCGLGNEDWNCSAPHGAGRKLRRSDAKKELSLDSFKDRMTNVYSSCVDATRLDESPEAYKDTDEIIKQIEGQTVKIIKRLTPIFNFKG